MTKRKCDDCLVWERLDDLEQLVNLIVGRLEIDVVGEAVVVDPVPDEEVLNG